jgi:uncharacterized protein
MASSFFAHAAALSIRFAWLAMAAAGMASGSSVWYASRHFAVNTDVSKLLSPDLAWRKREMEFKTAFPELAEAIIAVVEAPTPELSGAAADTLAGRLKGQDDGFRSVQQAGGGDFFARNQLLYLPADEVARTTQQLGNAAPFIQVLAADPSLRGILQALSSGIQGAQSGRYSLDDLTRTLNMAADTIDAIVAHRPASFSWQVLVKGTPAGAQELRRLVEIWPVLDYAALESGHTATAAIRRATQDAELEAAFSAAVHLTGPVPIADQEFAALREGVALNGVVTSAIVLVILWLALRSLRIVAAVVVSVFVGLTITAAVGLLLFGALNPISMAFVVLFVGLGADFAIQFSVRYRSERHADDSLRGSLIRAARRVGAPLTLAAAAAAAGFLAFLPTSYRGLAELGSIAGVGMVIAYAVSMTLLPALLSRLDPPPEPRPLGYAALAPVDHFLQRHRIAVVAGTSIVVLAGLPFLVHLQFDFSPMSLQDPKSDPIATLHRLSNDPRLSTNAAQVLVPQSEAADRARRLSALPEVAQVRTLDSFIPSEQDNKLALIGNAAASIEPALQVPRKAAPSDSEGVAALRHAADQLRQAANEGGGPGPEAARRLADDLAKLAAADAPLRAQARTAFVQPLERDLAALRQSLRPERVTRSNIPRELVRDWLTTDGRMRLEITPRGNPDDSEILRNFSRVVLSVEPDATGQAIETYEWGNTIIVAFLQAGGWALVSITILLWIVLRRFRDVLVTLVPLLIAAVATLEVCALSGFALNYANIIALPVLLGVGVAFKIYYVMAWRGGETDFLQSSLTRAVFFSALMTATAFGSLWLSNHPGMSSMGKLLALSLLCTLASAALFQPALMGPPRDEQART